MVELDSGEFDLKRSKEAVGHLYPVLIDARGKVIDGFHRLEVDPNWPKQKLEWVKNERTREIVRLNANLMRREIPREERQEGFLRLAQLVKEKGVKRKHIVTELSKITGFTDRYVREMLPDEFKAVEFKHKEELVPPPPEVKCELQRLLGDLVAGVETQHNYEANCDQCEIRDKCDKLRGFLRELGYGD